MKNNIKVSIIVPVYNTAKYLPKCLDSVKNQTLKDIEIICINDGSTDNSLDVLNKYSQEDSRFVILMQENQGQSVARNTGIKLAKGEYIGFVDSDDYIELTMFEKLYENANQNKADISMCCISTFDENNTYPNDPYMTLDLFPKEFEHKTFDFNSTSNFLFRICVTPWNKIFKKNFLLNNIIFFPEGLFFEDNVFFYESYFKAKKISLLKEKLYNYRKASSTSTTYGADIKKLDFYGIFEKIETILKDLNLYKEYKEYFSTHKKNTLIYWYKKLNDKKVKKEYAKRFKVIYNEDISKHIKLTQKA